MIATDATEQGIRAYRIVFAIAAAAVLCLPLVAMQVTNEVDWSAGDFLLAAGLLFALGAAIDMICRKIGHLAVRMLGAGLVLVAFVLIWAMLATG